MNQENLVINSLMRKILSDGVVDFENENNAHIGLNNILKLIDPTIIEIHDCLIIDNTNKLVNKKIDLNFILKTYGFKSNYESSRNENRINDYIDGNIKDPKTILNLGFQFQGLLERKLKSIYPSRRFCFIVFFDGEYVTTRFHTVRDNDPMVLSDDIESYTDVAVAYKIV